MSEELARLGIIVDSDGVLKSVTRLKELKKQSGKNERANQKLGSSFGGLQFKILAVAAAYGTLSVVKDVASTWRDFGATMADLSAITGATGKDLEYLKEQSIAIGKSTTLSASQAATAFKLIASAKPDLLESGEALAAVTREAVTLAEAAGIDMPTAAKALGASLNQFSADADEANRFINVLAAGAKYGASEISETAEALKKAGTVAASAGISFEETNAAIQTLAGVALKGSEAGTQLKTIIIRLRTAGIDKLNPSVVGLSQAFKNLRDAQLPIAELQKLVGLESLAAAEALMKNADATEILTGKLTGTNTAAEQASVKYNTLDGDLLRMNSAFESLALVIGEEFDPAMRSVIQLITGVTTPVQIAILEFTDLGDAIGASILAWQKLLSFDYSGFQQVDVDRQEQRKLVDDKIAKLKKDAEDAAAGNGGEGGGGEGDGGVKLDKIEEDFKNEFALVADNFASLIELTTMHDDELKLMGETTLARKQVDLQNEFEMNEAFFDDIAGLSEKKMTEDEELWKASWQGKAKIMGGAMDGIGQLLMQGNAKQIKLGKKFAKASIIMDTAVSVMKAAANPWPVPALPLTIKAGMLGAAQLAKVGGGGGGGSVSGGSVSGGSTVTSISQADAMRVIDTKGAKLSTPSGDKTVIVNLKVYDAQDGMDIIEANKSMITGIVTEDFAERGVNLG